MRVDLFKEVQAKARREPGNQTLDNISEAPGTQRTPETANTVAQLGQAKRSETAKPCMETHVEALLCF